MFLKAYFSYVILFLISIVECIFNFDLSTYITIDVIFKYGLRKMTVC